MWAPFSRPHGTSHFGGVSSSEASRTINRLHKINPVKYTDPHCRACRAPNETMLHLLTCPGLRQVRDHVSRLMTALGAKPHDIHQHTTILLLLNSNYKILDELPRAVIRIYWRVAYAGLAKAGDERKRYQPEHIKKAICRSLMLRILAYQKSKRDFFENEYTLIK